MCRPKPRSSHTLVVDHFTGVDSNVKVSMLNSIPPESWKLLKSIRGARADTIFLVSVLVSFSAQISANVIGIDVWTWSAHLPTKAKPSLFLFLLLLCGLFSSETPRCAVHRRFAPWILNVVPCKIKE